MGVRCLYCCFEGMSGKIASAIGLGASILSFGFMMWGIIDIYFEWRGIKALYIIIFVLLCLCLLGFITLLVLACMGKNGPINQFAKILCIVLAVFCALAFIAEVVVWIFLIVDYVDAEKDGGPGQQIPSHDWAAIFVPTIIALMALIVMALVANYLHKVFTDKLNATTYPTTLPQTTVSTIPNPVQPGMFPNNNGPISPMENNIAYPVAIKQNE